MQSSGRKLSSHVPQTSPHGLFLLSIFTRNGNKASPIYLPVRHQSAYVKSSRLFNAILRSYIVITIPYSRMKTSEKNPTDFVLGVLPGVAYMPTLPDYPGVSRIRNESPGLPYGSPHLPDKSDFGLFLYIWLIF